MNILVITAHHPPYHLGGYELRCKNVLDALSRRGHSITIVTNSLPVYDKEKTADNVYRVLHLAQSRPLVAQVVADTQDIRWIRKLIQQKKVDVLYLWHTIVLSRTIFPFVAELNLPIVYDEGGLGLSHAWAKHGDWINYCDRKRTTPLREWFKRITCQLAKFASGGILPTGWRWPEKMHLYFNSQSGLDAAKLAGVPVEKARVIYSGLQLDDFPYKQQPIVFDEKIRLIVPGRIVRIKAVDSAIKVLLCLKSIRPDKHFEMLIVGPATDALYFKELQHLAIANGLQNDLQSIEQVSHQEMAALYASTEFCLFPSAQKEGLSRVPLEAMACGSLVVSAGYEGSSEVIQNGLTGIICAYDDPFCAAGVIAGLIDTPLVVEAMRKTARKTIEDRFTVECAVDQIESVLNTALSQHNP